MGFLRTLLRILLIYNYRYYDITCRECLISALFSNSGRVTGKPEVTIDNRPVSNISKYVGQCQVV
jgi:hypothetical protein